MADPFLAEIRIFPFSMGAPRGWALCDGQILPLSQNTALFSLLGTTYGGDGKSNFALPNLQGRVPMHPGQGPGLSLYDLGQEGGSESVTLLQTEMPAHTHQMKGQVDPGDLFQPQVNGVGNSYARSNNGSAYHANNNNFVAMNQQILKPTGNGQPHNNMMPFNVFWFCIALQGVFPPRG